MKKKNFVDYTFLSELDSVRTSLEDQIKGENALFKALVYDGKVVVLTYNQIADSITFLHCIRNEETFLVLLKFFKDKRLVVKYDDEMNLSKYIQEKFKPGSTFISSYFSFMNKYPKKVIDIVFLGIVESVKYGDDLFLKAKMPLEINASDQKEIYNYVKLIIKINNYMYDYKCYVKGKSKDELKGKQLVDYMKKILAILKAKKSFVYDDFNKVICEYNKGKYQATRSDHYHIVENNDIKNKALVKKLIDIAYNSALEASIPINNVTSNLEKQVDEVLTSFELEHTDGIASINKKWQDGYRMTSLTSYIFLKFNRIKWNILLSTCPVLEVFRIIMTLFFSFTLMIVFNYLGGLERFWLTSSVSILITFIYNYLMNLIEDKIVEKLPDWYVMNIFCQIKNFFTDIKIIKDKRK